MPIEFLIKMLVAMLGQYLIVPSTAAKYAKWFIRARDYLNLLFPLDRYPEDYGENILTDNKDRYAVPEEAVKKESENRGFNLPFIKGM